MSVKRSWLEDASHKNLCEKTYANAGPQEFNMAKGESENPNVCGGN